MSTELLLYGAVYRYIWENLVKWCLNCCRKIWENLVKLYLVCHFRGIFVANLKRGHNDTNSTGKDKLVKAQLLSSTSINIAQL